MTMTTLQLKLRGIFFSDSPETQTNNVGVIFSTIVSAVSNFFQYLNHQLTPETRDVQIHSSIVGFRYRIIAAVVLIMFLCCCYPCISKLVLLCIKIVLILIEAISQLLQNIYLRMSFSANQLWRSWANYRQVSHVPVAGIYHDQTSSQSATRHVRNSIYDSQHSSSFQKQSPSKSSHVPVAGSYNDQTSSQSTTTPVPNATNDNLECSICFTNPKDMVFGCGHQTCCECGQTLQLCPFCRKSIDIRIKRY